MRHLLWIALLWIGAGLMAVDADGHGGSFRGPNGGVPPNLRNPFDPEPPPPPPSDPGSPGPTPTPHDQPGEITPSDPNGPSTGNGQTPVPSANRDQRNRGPKTPSLTFESWRFWWGYNNDDILCVKSHLHDKSVISQHPLFGLSDNRGNLRSALRPTQRKIETEILPAMLRLIDHPGVHEDIHGAALIAVGKAGHADHISMLEAALFNRYRNSKGKKLDFGYQATESAALALGLLPDLDPAGKRAVRRVCLEAIDDDNLRTRERTWAAVSLGLQRDGEAVPELMRRLEKRYPDDNIPAGIVCAIGLMGDCEAARAVLPELETCVLRGRLMGQEVNQRVRAFACYALAKIGDPQALNVVLKVLGSRRVQRPTRRSAAIAAGVLGAKAGPDERDAAVHALISLVKKGGRDPSMTNFALVSLGRIGTDDALRALLKVAENGRYGQRPFAGLALATCVFYRDRAAKAGEGEALNPKLRERIVAKLADLSDRFKDVDTRAAFLLCRGLVKDQSAGDELVRIIAKRSTHKELRAYSCVALGLLGRNDRVALDALRLALRERGSAELRRSAATGLALLHDSGVVDLLLAELKKAKSFAVQGQLILAIGTVGHQGAITPLTQLAEDRSQPAQTRALATAGIGMIADLKELRELGRLAKDYNYRASVKDLDELLFIL